MSAKHGENVISMWEQLYYTSRTNLTGWYHNMYHSIQDFSNSYLGHNSHIDRLRESPVWLLGRLYYTDLKQSEDEREFCLKDFISSWMDVMRMTYRFNMDPLWRPVRSGDHPQYVKLTSDAGWGCMIRVAQMSLHQSLLRHYQLERLDFQEKSSVNSEVTRERLLSWFFDKNSFDEASFSIYSFIAITGGLGEDEFTREKLPKKLPGDWFGPHSVSQTMTALCDSNNVVSETLSVVLARDGVIYLNEVAKLLFPLEEIPSEDSERNLDRVLEFLERPWPRKLLLLCPVQFGAEQTINMVYSKSLKQYFKLPQSLGMMGGRPRLAHYFIGITKDELLYIDPHFVQEAALTSDDTKTFSNSNFLHTIDLNQVQPSNSLLFYLDNFEDLLDFINKTLEISKSDEYASLQIEASTSLRTEEALTTSFTIPDGDFELIVD